MKRLTALILGALLRWVGLWLQHASFAVERWGDVEPVKAGGTD